MSSGTWDGLTPPYATIVADPPWPYEGEPAGDLKGKRPTFLPYSVMSLDEISRLPVADLAAPSAHLYLWTTQRFLWDARDIALGWGFVPAQVLVWCKEPRTGFLGGYFSDTTEFVIFAHYWDQKHRVERAGTLIRQAREAAGISRQQLHVLVRDGKPTGIVYRWEANQCLPNAQDWERLQAALPTLRETPRPHVPKPEFEGRVTTTWFQWPRGAHSQKPPAFLDLVEHVSPGPYVELFARQPRLGWDSWGWGYEQQGGAA